MGRIRVIDGVEQGPMWVPSRQPGQEVVIAIDISRSKLVYCVVGMGQSNGG